MYLMQRLQDLESNGLRDSADLRRHARKKTDFLPKLSVPVAEDLFHREAAFGGELLERYARLGILAEVFPRSGNSSSVLFAQSFVFGVNHDLEQLHNGRDLVRARLLDRVVGLLPGLGRISVHCVLPASRPGGN